MDIETDSDGEEEDKFSRLGLGFSCTHTHTHTHTHAYTHTHAHTAWHTEICKQSAVNEGYGDVETRRSYGNVCERTRRKAGR